MASKPGPEPTGTNTVTFVEGAYGVRTGGGALTQEVAYAEAAVAPTITAFDGWKFTGWDKPFDSVTNDLTVTAQYVSDPTPVPVVVTNTVVFLEGGHGVRSGGGDLVQKIAYAEAAVAPTITADAGWKFTGWDKPFGCVTNDLIVTAQYMVDPGPEPTVTNTVVFVEGAYGVRTGGGALTQEVAYAEAAVEPTITAVTGWKFTGWDKPFGCVTNDLMVTAQYVSDPTPVPVVVTNTVEFVIGDHGEHTGGGELVQQIPSGTAAVEPTVTAKAGWSFLGWDESFSCVTNDLTVTAQYERWLFLAPENDELPDVSAANIYDGYAYDDDFKVVATIQVKTAKASKGVSKVTATVVWAKTGSKLSFKGGVLDPETGAVSKMTNGGVSLEAKVGAVGLTGTFAGYAIDGARNVFSAKDAYAKTVASAVTAAWKGNYNLVWTDANGLNVLAVSIAAKGKVKLSGTCGNGQKISTSAQMIAGKDGALCGIPVMVTKKAYFELMIWLSEDGTTVEGVDGAVLAPISGLEDTCSFSCATDNLIAAIKDYAASQRQTVDRVLDEYLPNGLSVRQSGSKWIVDDGNKTGQVVINKSTGEIDEAKSKIDGYNVSGLKLTYTAKTGAFKGSFKVYYVVESKGSYSLKNVSLTVSGTVVGGVGYGSATNKKLGVFEVRIE